MFSKPNDTHGNDIKWCAKPAPIGGHLSLPRFPIKYPGVVHTTNFGLRSPRERESLTQKGFCCMASTYLSEDEAEEETNRKSTSGQDSGACPLHHAMIA